VSDCLYFVHGEPNVAAPAMAATGRLKIRVERNECKGHARCKSPAPELVELDEHGKTPMEQQ
jgi:hypothetical protein